LKTIQSECVDVAVTSPPYDDLRAYKGNYKLDLIELGKEVFRVLKNGGIYVMVIQDQTKNYGKSLTSFRTAIAHCDEIGFKLFETCIYKKLGGEGAWWGRRFRVDHEYIHIFLKGAKPQYFNKTLGMEDINIIASYSRISLLLLIEVYKINSDPNILGYFFDEKILKDANFNETEIKEIMELRKIDEKVTEITMNL